MKDVDCTINPVAYCKHMRYNGMIYRTEDGFKFGLSGASEDSSAINAILSGLYHSKYADLFSQSGFTRSRYDKNCIMLVKYFVARDGLKLNTRKKDQSSYFDLKITDKDNEIFMKTQFALSFDLQKKCLIALKEEIEHRHKEKGEGFMSLIRR